jgi:hypothetical protein
MAASKDKSEVKKPLEDDSSIQDLGGTRSGRERRQRPEPIEGHERRTGRDRRRGFDRRSGIERRRSGDRRNERYFRDGESVERRDVFRRREKTSKVSE